MLDGKEDVDVEGSAVMGLRPVNWTVGFSVRVGMVWEESDVC